MTAGADHELPPSDRTCERLQTLLLELPESECFDLDEFAPHLESCPTCSAHFPEVCALLGLGSTPLLSSPSFGEPPILLRRDVFPAPRPQMVQVPPRFRRVATTLAAACFLCAVATALYRADTDAHGPAAPLHSQIDPDHSAPAAVSSPEPAPSTRIDGTTWWTQVSYAGSSTARSTIQTTILRPNQRIRATVNR